MPHSASRARAIVGGGLCTLVAGALLCGFPLYALHQFREQFQYRCARHPPEETFRRFVSPDLAGISDVRAMGHSSIGGANVFVRFRVTDEALQRLLTGYGSGEVDEDGANHLEQVAMDAEWWSRSEPPRSSRYEVRAEEIRKLRKPVIYQKRGSTAEGWSILVLDRPHRRVYFYHWNQ